MFLTLIDGMTWGTFALMFLAKMFAAVFIWGAGRAKMQLEEERRIESFDFRG